MASRGLGVYSGCIQDHLGDGVNPNNCDYEKKLTDRLGVKGQQQKCLKCNLSLEFVTQDKEALFYQDRKCFQSITAMIKKKE